MNCRIIFLKETDSTNTRVTQLARDGEAEGLVVWADAQTAGKGRRGRSWESPAGDNLYFSVLLRPETAPGKAPMLTLIMACAAARAIDRVFGVCSLSEGGEGPQIKWPNDLVLAQKKICGILTEMYLNGTAIDHVVIGTGINVNVSEFPEELRQKATSLLLETGRRTDRERLLEAILEEFDRLYQQFISVQDLSFLQEEYNEKLVNKNREVLVLEPGQEYQGVARGINSKGELLVETEDGIKSVFAGEVSVRGIYGYV